MDKYLLQQPNSLETLAMASVVDWVTIQAEDLVPKISQLQSCYPTKAEEVLSRRIETIRNHIQKQMAPQYYNEFTSILMKAIVELLKKTDQLSKIEHSTYHENANSTVSQMIEIAFTKNLTSIVFDDRKGDESCPEIEYNTWDIFKTSFLSRAYMLSGLVHLKITSHVAEHDIIQLLKQLPNLKSLSIRVASENIKCIANNCKLIEILDLSFNDKINDRSIERITQLRHLKEIYLESTAVTKEGIVKLLLLCQNIQKIYVGNKISIAPALKYITSAKKHVNKQFKLTSYNDSSETTAGELKLVVEMCPRLQSVRLSSNVSSHGYLLPLRDLTELRILEIYSYDFYSDGVKDVLEARGAGLEQIQLHLLKGIDSNALACIYRTCPNLQSLYFRSCTFQKDNLRAVSSSDEVRIAPLKYLKTLTIILSETKPSNDHLIFLFSNCPNVEFVDICEANILTDEIMYQVLVGRNWMHLKELKLCITGLSSEYVIDLIVQNCVGQPEVITYNAVCIYMRLLLRV